MLCSAVQGHSISPEPTTSDVHIPYQRATDNESRTRQELCPASRAHHLMGLLLVGHTSCPQDSASTGSLLIMESRGMQKGHLSGFWHLLILPMLFTPPQPGQRQRKRGDLLCSHHFKSFPPKSYALWEGPNAQLISGPCPPSTSSHTVSLPLF